MSKERKVWVAQVPSSIGVGQVLIEQFGDDAPTVAFREEKRHVWGRPYRSEVAP